MDLPDFVHFPWLHPALAPQGLPPGCVFLDPGLAVAGMEYRSWRPRWPYSDAHIARLVADYLRQAEEAARPSDLAAQMAVGVEDFYADSSLEIRAQLTGGAPAADPAEERLRQAQVLLALELTREKAWVDLVQQQQRLAQARQQWQESLGVDEDELRLPEDEPLALGSPAEELDWRPLVLPMDLVLPPSVALLVADPGVVAQWQAAGVVGEPGDLGFRWCRLDDAAVRALGCVPRGELSGRAVAIVTKGCR